MVPALARTERTGARVCPTVNDRAMETRREGAESARGLAGGFAGRVTTNPTDQVEKGGLRTGASRALATEIAE